MKNKAPGSVIITEAALAIMRQAKSEETSIGRKRQKTNSLVPMVSMLIGMTPKREVVWTRAKISAVKDKRINVRINLTFGVADEEVHECGTHEPDLGRFFCEIIAAAVEHVQVIVFEFQMEIDVAEVSQSDVLYVSNAFQPGGMFYR